jgi:tetratricopeptide (TPR) repeat protein
MASGPQKAGNAAEIDRLAVAFAKEPGSKVFIPLAEEYGKAGMWEEAVAVLEDGLKTYPSFITAMVALGRAYEQLNQPVKAKAILEEAVKLSPDNLRAHRTLARLYAAEGAEDAAIRSCNVILSVNPRDQEALSLRAGFDGPTPHGAGPLQGQLQEKPAKPEHRAPDLPGGKDLPTILDSTTSATKEATDGLRGCVPRSEDISIPTASSTAPASPHTRRPVIVQLEQWLNLIQTRRRNPHASSSLRS